MLTYRRRLLQNVEKTVRAGWANTDRRVEMSASFSVVTELRVDGTRSQVSPVNIFRRVLSTGLFRPFSLVCDCCSWASANPEQYNPPGKIGRQNPEGILFSCGNPVSLAQGRGLVASARPLPA